MDIVSDFVIDLADLADPLAHDLIHAAYQADLVDTFFAGDEKSLKADYEHGGGAASHPNCPPFSRAIGSNSRSTWSTSEGGARPRNPHL